MRPISELDAKNIKIVLTDIDDTLTDEGRVKPETYTALWSLKQSGFTVIPVTGRPAGWCELIARQWPVDWVIGENGAFAFGLQNRGMSRLFYQAKMQQTVNKKKLQTLQKKILKSVPGCKVASDQFSRIFDLAIDFAEDVNPPLTQAKVMKIQSLFQNAGATAKVSSIHVNGWFGTHDKLKMCLKLLQKKYSLAGPDALACSVFVGDSPNDEPMFRAFPNSVGVASVVEYKNIFKDLPKFICQQKGGAGFVEVAEVLLKNGRA